jgi:hypothetical protein
LRLKAFNRKARQGFAKSAKKTCWTSSNCGAANRKHYFLFSSLYAVIGLSANIFGTVGSLVSFGIYLLELIFALGLAGSVVVLVLSGIEDIETLAGSDDASHH